MAKIVKAPLEMANGTMVRNIEELKENFDIKKAVGYFLDGKLQKWLEVRRYEEELKKVSELSEDDTELAKKLCDIFGVEYIETVEINAADIKEENERLLKLKQYTDDEEIIANIDSVAFNQEELADLYDRGVEKIYLCEGEFKIPKSKEDQDYVVLNGAKVNGLKERKIQNGNISLNDEMRRSRELWKILNEVDPIMAPVILSIILENHYGNISLNDKMRRSQELWKTLNEVDPIVAPVFLSVILENQKENIEKKKED